MATLVNWRILLFLNAFFWNTFVCNTAWKWFSIQSDGCHTTAPHTSPPRTKKLHRITCSFPKPTPQKKKHPRARTKIMFLLDYHTTTFCWAALLTKLHFFHRRLRNYRIHLHLNSLQASVGCSFCKLSSQASRARGWDLFPLFSRESLVKKKMGAKNRWHFLRCNVPVTAKTVMENRRCRFLQVDFSAFKPGHSPQRFFGCPSLGRMASKG